MSLIRTSRAVQFLRPAYTASFSSFSRLSCGPRVSATTVTSSSSSVHRKPVVSSKVPSRSFFGLFKKKEAPQPTEKQVFLQDMEYPEVDPFYADKLPEAERKKFLAVGNFNAWMDSFLCAGSYTQVSDVFLLMMLKGVEPDAASWAIVVEAYKRDGRTEDLEPFALQVAAVMEMSQAERDEVFTKLMNPPTEADIAEAQAFAAADAKAIVDAVQKGEQHHDHDHDHAHDHGHKPVHGAAH